MAPPQNPKWELPYLAEATERRLWRWVRFSMLLMLG